MKLENYVLGKWTPGDGDGAALHNAINGDIVATASTKGLDFADMLAYGRATGGPALRKMTFWERGNMLKKLALYLTKRKDQFYPISYQTGATKVDSWIDIEGGFGNLFANASLRRNFPNQTFHVDGDPIDLSTRRSIYGASHHGTQRRCSYSYQCFQLPRLGHAREVCGELDGRCTCRSQARHCDQLPH